MDNLNLTTNSLIGAGEAATDLAALAGGLDRFPKTQPLGGGPEYGRSHQPSGWGT